MKGTLFKNSPEYDRCHIHTIATDIIVTTTTNVNDHIATQVTETYQAMSEEVIGFATDR